MMIFGQFILRSGKKSCAKPWGPGSSLFQDPGKFLTPGEGWSLRDGGAEEAAEALADVDAKDKLPASDTNSEGLLEASSSVTDPDFSVGILFTSSLMENDTFQPESRALSIHRAKSDHVLC